MKKVGFFIAVAFAFALPHTASAITSQVIMGGNTQFYITSASAARYTSLFSNQNVTWANSVTSGISREVISAAGYITKFTVNANRALGAGSYTATVIKNGVAQNLACTITSPASSCTDTQSMRVAVGDQLELRVLGSGGPNLIPITTAFDFVPDVANETLVGTTLNSNLTVFSYDSFVNRNGFVSAATAESTSTQSLMDVQGTFSALQIAATTAPGAGRSSTYSVRLNQATSSLACTVSDTGKTCSSSSYLPTQQGSWINLSMQPTGAVTANGILGVGMKFVPTVVGQFFFIGGSGADNQGTTGTVYETISGGMATSSRVDAQMVANDMVITSFTVGQTSTTGASRTRTYTLEVNGSPTTATCSTSGTTATTGRTCSWQGSITVNAGDLVNYVQTVTGGTATNSVARISTTAYRAPSPFQNKIMGGFMRIMGGFIRIK